MTMSQQMHFDEEQHGYQATYTPPINEQRGPEYADSLGAISGQKLGASYSGRSPSPGQRLALAIVSVCCVMLSALATLTSGPDTFSTIIAKLIALVVVCATLVIINVVFNIRHSW
jgi:hypothetical protein